MFIRRAKENVNQSSSFPLYKTFLNIKREKKLYAHASLCAKKSSIWAKMTAASNCINVKTVRESKVDTQKLVNKKKVFI